VSVLKKVLKKNVRKSNSLQEVCEGKTFLFIEQKKRRQRLGDCKKNPKKEEVTMKEKT